MICAFRLLIAISFLVTSGCAYRGPFKIASGHPCRKPAKVYLPKEHHIQDPQKKLPLIMLLHGYAATGGLQDLYFGLSERISSREFVLLVPEGMRDKKGNQFWNATKACCDFDNSGVNDVEYLSKLVRQTIEAYGTDPDRTYIVGHSNGGFMAHRLACEDSGQYAAIASLAGLSENTDSGCQPTSPVSVLQIHAKDDKTVRFDGGAMYEKPYPGATETAMYWAKQDGCDGKYQDLDPLKLIHLIPGDDTSVRLWSHCRAGSQVALWTIKPHSSLFYSAHIPWISWEFTDRMLDFLLAARRKE